MKNIFFILMFAFSTICGAQSYFQGVNLIQVPATTATAGSTTTLTSSSQTRQQFTGSTTQTVVLPNATTLQNGRAFYISNRSSGVVTVEYNDASTAQVMAAGTEALFIVISNATSDGSWDISYLGQPGAGSITDIFSGTGLLGGPITSVGTLSVDVGTAANKIVQLTVNAQYPAADGFLITNVNAAGVGGLVAGQVVFPSASGALTGSSNFTWDNTNGKLSVFSNQSVPSNPRGIVHQNSGGTGGGFFAGIGTRGTVSSPSASQSGDVLLTLQGIGYGTSGLGGGQSQIQAQATQTFTNSNNGQQILFKTVPNNASSNGVALLIGQDKGLSLYNADTTYMTQYVGVGTTSYSITWPSTQGAVSSILTNNGSGALSWTPGASLTNVNAAYLQSFAIATTSPTNGQALTWNSTLNDWNPQSASGVALSSITAATGSNTINNVANPQEWDWNSLTTGTAFTLGSSSITSGTILQLNSTNNSSSATGSILGITSTGNSNATNGITINLAGSSDSSAATYGISVTNATEAGSSYGVFVNMSNASLTGANNAVYAQSASTFNGSRAGFFDVSGASGSILGIEADNSSSDAGAKAAYFHLMSGSSAGFGLDVLVDSSSGTPTVARFTNNSTNGFTINAIGTTAGTKQVIQVENSATAANNNAAGIVFSDLVSGATVTQAAEIDGMMTNINASTYAGALIFKTANNAAPSEAARFNSQGRLGIATTTPNGILDVEGTGTVIFGGSNTISVGIGTSTPGASLEQMGHYRMDGATAGYLDFSVPATVTTYSVIWPSAQSSGTKVLQNDGSGNLSWAAVGSGTVTSITAGTGLTGGTITSVGTINVDVGIAANKILQVSSNGNVGIGTTSPQATLDVNGGIDISGANGIFYPADSTAAGASIGIGVTALTEQNSLGATQFQNTAIGYQAMSSTSMTTGATQNTALGFDSLKANTSGSSNVAIGRGALAANTTGNQSVGVGRGAIGATTTSGNNTGVGYNVLQGVTGSANTAVGLQAMGNSTQHSASNNTAIGFQAGYDLTTGADNIIIGYYNTTNVGISSGSNNIVIGQNLQEQTATSSNQLNIGNLIFATGLGNGTTMASGGGVGIGITAPQSLLDVNGGISVGSYAGNNAASTGGMIISGNVGIGTTSASAQLHTTGSVRFANFGAGAATFDASGNISSASDERLKNIQRYFTSGLKELSGVRPITFKWNEKSGMETGHEYSGFSAQNVGTNIPEALGMNEKGYYSIQDRAIMATLVNAVNELSKKVDALEAAQKEKK